MSNKEELTKEVKDIRLELLSIFSKIAHLLKRIGEVEKEIRKLPEEKKT